MTELWYYEMVNEDKCNKIEGILEIPNNRQLHSMSAKEVAVKSRDTGTAISLIIGCCAVVVLSVAECGRAAVMFDGMTWYDAHTPSTMFLNDDGLLEWVPYNDHQIVVRIPDQDLSDIGDVVEISYYWLSDGRGNTDGCDDCQSETCNFNKDITCVSGTGDFRVGLFESDGDYITADGMGIENDIFRGYKGYKFCMQPHVDQEPVRWVEPSGEPHIAGGFYERDMVDDPRLLSVNRVFDRISMFGGFELALNSWSPWIIRIERLSSTSIKMSITLNGITYTDTDTTNTTSVPQPRKIDVFAIEFPNPNPYTRVVLDKLCVLDASDFNNNGIVDENDLILVTSDWLESTTYSQVGIEPNDGNELLWYRFDETAGSTAHDWSGRGLDGTLIGKNNWSSNGYEGGCLTFGDDTRVEPPSTVLSGIGKTVSFSVWVKGGDAGTRNNWVFDIGDGTYVNAIIPDSYDDVVWHAAGDTVTWLASTSADWEGSWVHYAFVKNANVGSMRIYRNGQKVAETTDAYNSMGAVRDTTFYIGAKQSHLNDYIGDMDDFRVYDYALSDEEVAYLGNEGWLVVPLDSRANLYDDDVMDFRDFAVFASQWLESCP